MDLCNEKDIRALLGRHGFRFSKSMGQNFLIEGWVPRDIAEASGAGPDTGVLEIGPGIGPLTVQLARRAAKVAAIELDRTLYPILAETLAPYPNAEVVPGDAMKLDLAALVSDKFSGLTVIACANLPYNITTPVLTALIEAGCFASITVMIQREVALRICAAPGSSDYGAFSVFCQYHTQPELLFEVGGNDGRRGGFLAANPLAAEQPSGQQQKAACTCPSCGHENPEGVKFCQECGTKLGGSAKKHCTSCGAELTPGTRFCGECGARQPE